MNYNRILSLIRYDWTINKHKLGLTMSLITIIYICVVILYFTSKSLFEIDTLSENVPYLMSRFISSFFNYAQLAMVFVVTTLLHQKFTNPRSATSYLSLPGTSAEKYFVMLAEYALGALAVFVLYLVCHSLTMIVCWWVSPEVSWLVNPFTYLFPVQDINEAMLAMEGRSWSETMQEMMENDSEILVGFINAVMAFAWFGPIFTLCEFFAYICVNMLFRTNGQLKTIAIYFASTIVLSVLGIITFVMAFGAEISRLDGHISHNEMQALVMNDFTIAFNTITYFCYTTPLILIGLAYLFYRQICRKQAK